MRSLIHTVSACPVPNYHKSHLQSERSLRAFRHRRIVQLRSRNLWTPITSVSGLIPSRSSVPTMSGNAPIKIAAEGERSNSRGHKLLTVHYAADAAEGIAPSAVLIWHHGYGEHVGRYKWGADKPTFLGSDDTTVNRSISPPPPSSCQLSTARARAFYGVLI